MHRTLTSHLVRCVASAWAICACLWAFGCGPEVIIRRTTAHTNYPDVPTSSYPGDSNIISDAPLRTSGCNSELSVFVRTVWLPTMAVDCLACHVQHGWAQAQGAAFTLAHPSFANYLTDNLASVRQAESLPPDPNTGLPRLLAKAAGLMPHGGGTRIATDSNQYKALQAFVTSGGNTPYASGCMPTLTSALISTVRSRSDADVLRRAALQLAARLPTPAESRQVAQGDLSGALDTVLADPNFGNFVVRAYDDMDKAIAFNHSGGGSGVELYNYNNNISPDDFHQIYWYENPPPYGPSNTPGVDDYGTINYDFSIQGLELARYIVMNNRPFTELLTANYMMLTPWTARSLSQDATYGLYHSIPWQDPNDPLEWQPVVLDNALWPTSGLLTDMAFLAEFATTPTNRNRKRARFIYQYFLGEDILTLSQRPSNLNQIIAAQDPNIPATMTNPACTDCHTLIDRMAKNYYAYGATGAYDPPNGNFGETPMFAAGFEQTPLPQSDQGNPVGWLASQITQDPRFARGVVRFWLTALTGGEPLGDVPATETHTDAYVAAQQYQDQFFSQVASDFVAAQYDLKVVVKGIVTSAYYRGVDLPAGIDPNTVTLLNPFINYQWAGPDALNNLLHGTTGASWSLGSNVCNNWGCSPDVLIKTYEGLLGGIDPTNNVTVANQNPAALMMRITTTMANSYACQTVAADFNKTASARQLFADIDPSVTPGTPNGPARIQATIQRIYTRITGANIDNSPDFSADLADAYLAFATGYSDARAAHDSTLPAACQMGNIFSDPTYALHGWLALMAYIVSAPEVLMQ